MKRIVIAAAAVALAGPAFAQFAFENVDEDNDGFITLPEALAAYPEMDPTDFDRIDIDSNRRIDPSEANEGASVALLAGLERAQPGNEMASDMSAYDVDGDSLVSYDEVIQSVPGVPQVYFQDFDLDNNGSLDSNEMASGAFERLISKYGS